MTQFQFDLICKIITNGAPALADELCGSLDAFVKAYNGIVAENEQLKQQITDMTTKEATSEDAAE
jgi:hypothetical protein